MSNLARNLFQELENKDQEIVQSWAKEAYVIRNDKTLSKPEKKLNTFLQLPTRIKLHLNF